MTLIGLVYFIILLINANKINSLVKLLIVAAIFEATAVVNLNLGRSIGINMFYLTEIFIIMYYIRKRIRFKLDTVDYLSLFFLVYCVFITLLAPSLFPDLLVYTPSLGIDIVDLNNLQPLSYSISNFAQVVYLSINIFVLIMMRNDLNIRVNFAKNIRSVGLLALMLGLLQFLLPIAGLSYPYDLINNNLSISQGYNQASEFTLYRIVSSFSEPSSAGSYFAALTLVFLSSITYFNRARPFIYIILIISVIMLFLSTSSTGILAFIAGVVIYSIYILGNIFKTGKLSRVNFTMTMISVSLIFMIIPFTSVAKAIFQDSILDKSSSASFGNRSRSNEYSIQILDQSMGLGVGIGSNRPSSLAFYLISNVGIFGTLLFIALIGAITYNFIKVTFGKVGLAGESTVVFWGFITILISKLIAQPDINQPSFWIFILCLGIISRQNSKNKKESQS